MASVVCIKSVVHVVCKCIYGVECVLRVVCVNVYRECSVCVCVCIESVVCVNVVCYPASAPEVTDGY